MTPVALSSDVVETASTQSAAVSAPPSANKLTLTFFRSEAVFLLRA